MFKTLLGIFLLVGCGTKDLAPKPGQATLDILNDRKTSLRAWAPTCDGNPSKEDCGEGDMTLFNGLLCFSGEQAGCRAVKAAQGPDGRFWRGPSRVGIPDENTFSRDMFLGVLAYLIATKDVDAAVKYQTYLDAHEWKLCDDATDNRCEMQPGLWGLTGAVWKYLGLQTNHFMNTDFAESNSALYVQAEGAPPGFETHLVGVKVLLKQRLGLGNFVLQATADKLKQRQPDNAFFIYLSEGPSQKVVDLILAQSPTQKPQYAYQWSFERTGDSESWRNSMGWEYVFLTNLIVR